jgi:hypothetical protein
MQQTSEAGVLYAPRGDATSEAGLNALAAVYRFILDCHTKKPAAGPSERGDNDEKAEGGSTDVFIVPE